MSVVEEKKEVSFTHWNFQAAHLKQQDLPHQRDRVEPPEEPSRDVGVVVVGEEGEVPLAQLIELTPVSGMAVLVMVWRLEVHGAHVVLLDMLSQALFSGLPLLVKQQERLSIELIFINFSAE